MLNKETIKEIALANGFKLKEQANGEMDLNPYVYEFVNAIAEHCWSAFKSGVMPHKIHPTKASLNNGWISVDDELPTQSEYYLVYDVNFGINVDRFYPSLVFGNAEMEKWEFQNFKNVTHWQPLPPLPKE